MTLKRNFTLLYFNIASLCVLMIGLELLGQVTYFLIEGAPLFITGGRDPGHARLFEHHPYLVARLRNNSKVEKKGLTISTTENHTRWTGAEPNDPNTIRVAVVGGSTTFGTRVTDADSWPAMLQKLLGAEYRVVNYGVPGYSTAEAIIQTALLIPEIAPHLIVFYEGWNDIRHYHNGVEPDYFSHGKRLYRLLGIANPESLGDNLAQTFATFWVTQKIGKRLFHSPITKTERSPDPTVDRIYLRNLKTLMVLTKHLGAQVLFIPQVLNEAFYKVKPGSESWTPRIANDAMPELLDNFNRIMDHVCDPGDAQCAVLKEVRVVQWKPDDFVDAGHFSQKGNHRFATIVGNYIREKANLD